MSQLKKMCAPFLDKKTCHTFMVCLWICGGGTEIRNCGTFCRTRRNLANAPYFHGKRQDGRTRRNSANAPYFHGKRQDGALWRNHQSAAHTVGEKRCTRHHVFKCHCGAVCCMYIQTVNLLSQLGGASPQ